MRHAILHSIAQNMATSLAGAHSPLTGMFGIDPWADVPAAGDTVIDLLSGRVESQDPSEDVLLLARAASCAFPDLCRRRGADPGAFVVCRLRFLGTGAARCVEVTVTDAAGRKSTRRYDPEGRHLPGR